MKAGVLDFGITTEKKFNLNNIFDYARAADALAYTRFWLSEHYTGDAFAQWNNPEMILPLIAATTTTIKVGAAGILLNMHSPYRVAMNFKLLANIFPKRIDLGLAKGIPKLDTTIFLLNSSFKINERNSYSEHLIQLLSFFRNEEDMLVNGVVTPPFSGSLPSLWYLTGSLSNLKFALDHKLNISKSLFHYGADNFFDKGVISNFKREFKTAHKVAPQINLACAIYCHEKTKHSNQKFGTFSKQANIDPNKIIVGSPNIICDTLRKYEEDSGINEFTIIDFNPNYRTKIRNIDLLSRQLGE